MFTLSKKESIQLFIVVNKSATVNNTIYPMIRLASTEDNTYEPYTSTDLTFPLGQDVYGGRYNVMSGELVIDRGIVDMGTLTWTYDSGSNRFMTTELSGLIKNAGIRATKFISSAYYSWDDASAFDTTKDGCVYTGASPGNVVYVHDHSVTVASDFKTKVTGQMLVYPLATPLTYVLTPQQLTTLSKSNVIMTDSGYISNCEYYADAKTYVDERFVYVITNSQIDDIFDTLE